MKEITKELLGFALETKYEDLPELVIHESKRIILDSISCALAGLSIDKGKLSVALARDYCVYRAGYQIVGLQYPLHG
ncbi:MmgE/PrpD family protein [Thermodesulfobacteriota bacterium]